MLRGTKQNGRPQGTGTPVTNDRNKEILHAFRGYHVDAGQLERLAVHGAFHGHVMSGMRRHFVLRVDYVHLLVGVVHEHVLGAVLLDALGGAIAGLLIRALYSTLAVGNVAGP